MSGAGHRARLVLVTGGARSGKSRFAEDLALRGGLEAVYLATAASFDDPEMAERIARHRADRATRWRTVEAPLELPDTLRRESAPSRIVLVDCLTLWLTNVMLDDRDIDAASGALVAALAALPGPAVLVTNEVGGGIVPDNALARRFRDAQGRLNQRVAAACDTVVLVAAGLSVLLKPGAMPRLSIDAGEGEIREIDRRAGLSPALLALNNAHAEALSLLSPERAADLVAASFAACRIGAAAALLIVFDQHADYDSPHFLWFRERFERFVYVDRVVVDPARRGGGLARRLYRSLFDRAAAAGHRRVVCEVNADPPNPASDAFHASLGFETVGAAALPGGKVVRYLARALA